MTRLYQVDEGCCPLQGARAFVIETNDREPRKSGANAAKFDPAQPSMVHDGLNSDTFEWRLEK